MLIFPKINSAEEVTILPSPLTQDDIIVSGNKKSKTSFIKKLVITCSKEDESPDYIKQCLERTRYFREVKVTINTQSQLDVQLQDGISFLGFPVIRGGDADAGVEGNVGVALFDTNSAGRGNLFVFFYDYKIPSGRSNFNLIYRFNNLGPKQDFGVTLQTARASVLHQQYLGQEWVYGAEEESSRLGVSFSHPAAHDKLDVSLDWSLDYTSASFGDNFRIDDPKDPLDERTNNFLTEELLSFGKTSLSFGYSITHAEQRDFYLAGLTFGKKFQTDLYSFTENDNFAGELPQASDIRLSTDFYLGVPSGKNQVFQLTAKHAIRQRDNAFDSYKIGGQLGSRAIPNSGLWGKEYGVISMEYQSPLVQSRSVIWSMGPFIDNGYMLGIPTNTNDNVDLRDNVNWVSGGLATYVYFRRVPIPAVGIAFGANDRFYPRGTVNFIIGQSF